MSKMLTVMSIFRYFCLSQKAIHAKKDALPKNSSYTSCIVN